MYTCMSLYVYTYTGVHSNSEVYGSASMSTYQYCFYMFVGFHVVPQTIIDPNTALINKLYNIEFVRKIWQLTATTSYRYPKSVPRSCREMFDSFPLDVLEG